MIAMKPLNMFALIDEEAFYPNGSDKSMLNKIKSQHGNNDLFTVTRAAQARVGSIESDRIQFFHEATNPIQFS
jgi:myosin heavy subunit